MAVDNPEPINRGRQHGPVCFVARLEIRLRLELGCYVATDAQHTGGFALCIAKRRLDGVEQNLPSVGIAHPLLVLPRLAAFHHPTVLFAEITSRFVVKEVKVRFADLCLLNPTRKGLKRLVATHVATHCILEKDQVRNGVNYAPQQSPLASQSLLCGPAA